MHTHTLNLYINCVPNINVLLVQTHIYILYVYTYTLNLYINCVPNTNISLGRKPTIKDIVSI